MYVVEKPQGERDAFRSAALDLAPADFADERAENDCVE
jgi:hypothetical protein